MNTISPVKFNTYKGVPSFQGGYVRAIYTERFLEKQAAAQKVHKLRRMVPFLNFMKKVSGKLPNLSHKKPKIAL